MRTVKDITKEENFRTEPSDVAPQMHIIRRDPIKPEPEGTIVLMAFRVTGYDPDCDGSLMGRFDHICFDNPNNTTGWSPSRLGLSPEICVVVTEDELKEMYKKAKNE